jgi:hypothetical protein
MAFAQGFAVGATVRQQREAAQQEKEIRDQELMKQGYSFENGQMSVRDNSAAQAEQLGAQEAAQLAKSLQAKLLAQTTDNAFEDYAHTGDASYLQKAIAKNPELKKAWAQRGVQTVDNVNFDQDHKILQSAGLQPTDYDTIEKRDVLKKNFYKVYDGEDWKLSNAHDAAAQTGVMSRLGERRAQPIQSNFEQVRSMILDHRRAISNAAKGTTNENVDQEIINQTAGVANQARGIEVQNRAVSEQARATDIRHNEFTQSLPLEKRKIDIAEKGVNEQVRQFDALLPYKRKELDVRANEADARLLSAAAKMKAAGDGNTTAQKDLSAAAETRKSMVDKFGGDDAFFATDFSDPEKYRTAYKDLVKVEKLEGTTPDAAQRKEMTDLREMLMLADPASKVGNNQTGIIDTQLQGAKKYLSDEVGGVEATAAYNALRNSFRHALYGATLSKGEIDSFDAAFGKLGNKAGPVLEQLKVALTQTKSRLQSVASLQDPWAAHVRLGKNGQQLDKILDSIDDRIAHFSGVKNPPAMPERKAALTSIFGVNTPAGTAP